MDVCSILVLASFASSLISDNLQESVVVPADIALSHGHGRTENGSNSLSPPDLAETAPLDPELEIVPDTEGEGSLLEAGTRNPKENEAGYGLQKYNVIGM